MENLQDAIKEMLQNTVTGKITWNAINPNAVRWVKTVPPNNTLVTLQKQGIPNASTERFILTIGYQPANPQNPPIQINSSEDPSIAPLLSQIFALATKEASRSVEQKKIDAIKKLMQGL
jgi:hypothetical protein